MSEPLLGRFENGNDDRLVEVAVDAQGRLIISPVQGGSVTDWATLLARLPAAQTPGLLPVDTLATPTVARVLATSSAAASVALTAGCRRISLYATQGAWYSLSGAATAGVAGTASSTSHYIGAGERLDMDVPATTTVSVLRDSTDGALRITELV